MGDIADMMAFDYFDFEDAGYDYYERKPPTRCRGCGSKELDWRHICGHWTLMEKSGGAHICHKYSPPIEVLKALAEEVTKKTKEDALWRLREKAKKRGGLTQLINIISDQDLLDLYAAFVKDNMPRYDDPEVGMGFGIYPSYDRELSLLKNEILRRMTK
jgi:hypothetical protein